MRYSTLASAVCLAAAPALAHLVTIRAIEDASMVERELDDGLMERGYYDTLRSRDLEARSGNVPKPPPGHSKALEVKQRIPEARNPNKFQGTPGATDPHHVYHIVGNPKAGGSKHNGGPGKGAEPVTVAGSMISTTSCSSAASR
ncbi:uncharacterized protein B0H18DRAFT_1106960 [Fomitopsis serialis]|uniref:uncharacterized protein n=1 Tax=Fomitopsis serialis TaxID=139415 RepID=UPI002007A226|nr:uncharacterized protein B0H18DRAFT_1106960 [Neoantrodia serialis]KAH9918304.1 hypothetical protein B0H18DRAFT_1106960 [Neoantrodia serialis]